MRWLRGKFFSPLCFLLSFLREVACPAKVLGIELRLVSIAGGKGVDDRVEGHIGKKAVVGDIFHVPAPFEIEGVENRIVSAVPVQRSSDDCGHPQSEVCRRYPRRAARRPARWPWPRNTRSLASQDRAGFEAVARRFDAVRVVINPVAHGIIKTDRFFSWGLGAGNRFESKFLHLLRIAVDKFCR